MSRSYTTNTLDDYAADEPLDDCAVELLNALPNKQFVSLLRCARTHVPGAAAADVCVAESIRQHRRTFRESPLRRLHDEFRSHTKSCKIIQDEPRRATRSNRERVPVIPVVRSVVFGTITIDVFNADTETKIGSTITLTVANAYGSRHRVAYLDYATRSMTAIIE